jgi:GTPase SAR1 family protein
VTNLQSFLNLREWLEKIREYSDSHIKIALVANKADLVDKNAKETVNFQGVIMDTEEGEP